MLNVEQIYTVSRLCRETRLVLESHFLSLVIEGEISNLSCPASGHIYFTLKDDKAQVQCAMFRTQLRKIGFKPSNGMHVILHARVSLYEARGNFQLIAEQMEPAGEGALRQKFEALKNKLSVEGLYDQAAKKPLPSLAKRVAVITSPTGAAIHDILSVLNSRFPALPVLIYPVTVQGETAKFDVVEALQLANARRDCDVIILARGGGSLEDLWAFNEEIVARAIYQSEIPVISAVGHEVDFSIADFVADYRAPTPSAAAETISPDQHQWLNQLDYLASKLSTILSRTLRDKRLRLERLQQLLERAHPGSQLQFHAQRLDECRLRLLQAPDHFIQSRRLSLSELNAKLLSDSPNKKIQHFQQRVESLQYRLSSNIQQSLQSARIRFTNCNKGLETLSPLATLSRGYSISKRQSDDSIINSTRQVAVGDLLNIQLTDGSLQAKLEGICENT